MGGGADESRRTDRRSGIPMEPQQIWDKSFLGGVFFMSGMRLAAPRPMSIFVSPCDRCGEYRAGDSYRVVSDSDGVRLLDMIVCYGCYIEASQLGLDTETIEMSELALH
jgi:formylmethanofuran dehydrogenase subunit E